MIPVGLSFSPGIAPKLENELASWIASRPAEPTRSRHRLELWGTGPFIATYGAGRRMGNIPPRGILADLAYELKCETADAITVSEYLPGQGVGRHVDREQAGPVIVSVALLSDAVLRFHCGLEPPVDVRYPRRGVMRMVDPVRSLPWEHELLPVIERRISIVFRRSS
jgi:hypothetical protein